MERIRRILKLLGNPQANFRCIIVGGSNGKGSTVEMIGSVLCEAGFRTGTYFSPQIEEFPERVRVNGKNAGKREIADAYFAVKEVCGKNRIEATFFEVVTAMALLIFRERDVDFAVLEVGLGGRLDAVNACEPEISAIASISLEHTAVLGDTVEKIAHEKCGIARKGKPLVCGFFLPDAKKAAALECRKIGAKAIFAEDAVKIGGLKEKNGGHLFVAAFGGKKYAVKLSASGKFQISNACAALVVCSKLGVGGRAIEKGLAKALPAYRFQKISSTPPTFADCAHNPEAAAALSGDIAGLKRAKGKRVLLFSAMKDKDYKAVLRALAKNFDAIVICEVSLERGANLVELYSASMKLYPEILLVKEPKRALAAAKKMAGKNGLLVVAGSIYLLAELYGRDKTRIAQ
ncbi:MAG: folylpolyglutamate synthase/dihydrofolate synthase family protein [Candidatus Micrarchaeia archaeon]